MPGRTASMTRWSPLSGAGNGTTSIIRDAAAPTTASKTANTTIEMRAHPRRRKISIAVHMPQIAKPRYMAAATMLKAGGKGGAPAPARDGNMVPASKSATAISNAIKLPMIETTALARIPIQSLCMIDEQSIVTARQRPSSVRGEYPGDAASRCVL